MKPRQNPFRISALNSLRVHEIPINNQKQLNNTFKGGNDLRSQLTKQKQSSPKQSQTFQQNLYSTNSPQNKFTTTLSQTKKPQNEILMDQVAALDNFKGSVTREKTRNMIQNIKLRRRQQHITAYNNFKQDLQDYKQNLQQIYESLFNDCQQVLMIKQQQLTGYFNSQSDSYLLGREKELLEQFQSQLNAYEQSSREKLAMTMTQLERVRGSRGSVVEETCEMLRVKLIEIAFVLEDEAREVENKEKQWIELLQKRFYQSYKQRIEQMSAKQQENITLMKQKMNEVVKKWRQLKETHEIQTFQSAIISQPYIFPSNRKQLYAQLIQLQQQNHSKKQQCIESLIKDQHVDSLRKINVDKWTDVLKTVNEEFDKSLDQLVKELMTEYDESKLMHERLIGRLEERLRYIGNHLQQQVTEMIATRLTPMVNNNNSKAQQMLKSATSYVQLNDQKQNTLIQNLTKFLTTISQTNDDFVKEFATVNQRHQLQQAKILDDDQQLVEKLTGELEQYKKQLKESLHHLRLEEVEKKCFEKIDEIQAAYRATHQKNKLLTAAMPGVLKQFMQGFEGKMAFAFQLYDQKKRSQLIERNKQDAERLAMKKIQQEDKKKQEQQEKQIQLIKKNGGKVPPAAKPKDPKKLAAQFEQRKKIILAQMGEKQIEEIKTGSGNVWLVYKSLQDISEQLYKPSLPEINNQPNSNLIPTDHNQSLTNPLSIDHLPQPIKNPLGHPITTSSTLLTIQQVSNYLLILRQKIFQNINVKKQRIFSETSKQDEEMMEQSLTMLDDRLKRHYSLKGELEAEIFVKRSGEITNHKKRYEKYARTVREKMDLQTERVNFLLEKALQQLKTHNTSQKQLKQQLPQGKNLSQLQGILSKARQNFNKFTQQLQQIILELSHLSGVQIQILLQKNKDFIKQSRPLKDGGQYSQQEIKWYQQMMNEITTQVKTQQSKRQQKTKEIQQQCDKRKKELLQKIEKDYHAQIEELSARQGTGKVYGKPKRTAQEKIRLEMNKCQQAQLSVNKQVQELMKLYQKEKSRGFKAQNRPETLKWRRQLMTLFTCIERYARHLQALKKDLKIKSMPRVNYDQKLSQCTVTSLQDDKKLLDQEIKALGPLGEQKQDKSFMKFIADIEKIISDESRTIYTGDKAKYLTGADRLPDFLRKYIAQMKQSAEDFRQTSIRELRDSCMRLGEFCEEIGELFFREIAQWFCKQGDKSFSTVMKQFSQVTKTHESQRTQHLRLLRPNLANPKCQDQLAQLNKKQLTRQTQFLSNLTTIRQQFKSTHFANGQTFICSLINNFQFLLQYVDSLFLFEDFVKIVGDDQENKPKLNIKKLMVMKQKGLNIDSMSERNLVKKWTGVDFTVINFDEKKFVYKKAETEDVAAKDVKKGAKKQAKKPSNNDPPLQTQSFTQSRQIQTFKTWRQKSIFQQKEKCLQVFGQKYTSIIAEMYAKLEQATKDNQMFERKWTKIAEELVIK